MALILLCLFILFFFDMALFKRLDYPLFKRAFHMSFPKIFFLLSVIGGVLIFSRSRGGDVPRMILLTIYPIYLLRRHDYVFAAEQSVGWQDARPSFKFLSDAIGVIVHWAFGIMVFGLLLAGVGGMARNGPSEMGELVCSAGFSSVYVLCLVYFASRRFSPHGFLTNVALRKGDCSWLKAAVFPCLLGLFFAFSSSYAMVTRRIQPETPLNEILETTQSVHMIVVFLFLAICVAPLVEEIVFRGYFFRVLKEWLGSRASIYIIALTFAFLHVGQYWGDWLAIAMVALLGLTLTLLRAWTGTTLAGVITHYTYNAGVTVIPVIMMAVSNPAYFEYKAYYPYHDAQKKEELLKASITRQPEQIDAYYDLARLYAEEDRHLDAALELIEQCLKFLPDEPAYLDTKAVLLEKLGRLEEASLIRQRLGTQGH